MYSPITPRQNICKPPKKHNNIIVVANPFGELLKKNFSKTVSKPIINAKNDIKKPKPAIILNGTILNDVIPFNANAIKDIKLNFDLPANLGFTSKLTVEVFNPNSWKKPLKNNYSIIRVIHRNFCT